MLQASEAVVVSFGGTLQQILSFDEEAGTITTNIWFAVPSFYHVSQYMKLLIEEFFDCTSLMKSSQKNPNKVEFRMDGSTPSLERKSRKWHRRRSTEPEGCLAS